MAYGVKYRLEFADIKGNKRKVEILKDGYSSTILPMVASGEPVVIEWKNDDDFYSNIIGSSCTLNLMVTDDVTYDNFLINGEKEWKIKVSHWNGSSYDTYWEGFVVIDNYIESIASTPYSISLKAYDGLGIIEGEVAPFSSTSSVNNYDTLFYYLRKILAQTNNLFDIYISNRIRKVGGATNDTLFHDISISEFGVMNQNITYKTSKELLELILKATNSRVFQSFGKWYVISNSNLIDANVTTNTNIRGDQTTWLQTYETEEIEYKVFNSAGTYQTTITPDILLKAPDSLKPINNDLIAEYLRPFKSVSVETKIYDNIILNENPHFLYGSNRYTTAVITSGKYAAVVDDTSYNVKALSANKYFHCNDIEVNTTGTWLGNIAMVKDFQEVEQNCEIQVGFSYYIESTPPATYEFGLKVYVDIDGSSPYQFYNFTNDEWDSQGAETNDNVSVQSTSSINNWGNFVVNLKPYRNTSYFGVKPKIAAVITRIDKTAGLGFYTKHYIDNFFVSQKVKVFGTNFIYERKKETPDQTANYTVEKNIISNKLSDTNALNTYEGSFTKPRYSTGYDLDLIITNEMLNDFRQFGKRYEGTFYKNDNSPLPCGLHNKVWFDFNTLQDPVSCYVDSMVYNVKQNAYSMVMHLPNQDVDIFAPVYEKIE